MLTVRPVQPGKEVKPVHREHQDVMGNTVRLGQQGGLVKKGLQALLDLEVLMVETEGLERPANPAKMD